MEDDIAKTLIKCPRCKEVSEFSLINIYDGIELKCSVCTETFYIVVLDERPRWIC